MAHNTTPPNWGRQWSPQHQNGDYVVMDTRVVHYEQHAAPSASMPRSMMAPPYMMSQPYSQGPMSTIPSPQYHSQPAMGYSHYTSSPTTLITPFHEQMRFPSAESGHSPITSHQETSRSGSEPSSRTLSTTDDNRSAQTKSTTVSVPGISKTVAPIVVVGEEATSGNFVDMLLKTIQAKPETDGIVIEHEENIKQEYFESKDVKMEDLPSPSLSQKAVKQVRNKEKKYFCDVAGCIQAFAQRPHLTIHRRTHFNDKPFACRYCNKRFTQTGNRKSHEATHTKIKPYPCEVPGCNKWFRQRSTAKQHLKTHSKLREFVCKLCEMEKQTEKRFALRGNLKTHLDTFHKPELQELQARVAASSVDALPEAERDLFVYFAMVFKNCNKGIKGRGKNTTKDQVQVATPPASNSSCSSAAHSPVVMHAAGPMQPHFHESPHHIQLPVINTNAQHHHYHQQHSPVHHHHHTHAHGLPSPHHHHAPAYVLPPVYTTGLPPPLVTSISMTPASTMAYDMHSAGTTPGSASNGELAFGDRIYH